MTTGVYNSYPTSIKIQAKLGLLQPEIKKLIPKTTLWGFKKTDFSTLFGFDYIENLDKEIETLRKFVQDKKAITFYKRYIVLQQLIIKLFVQVPKKLSINLKKKIVHAIDWFRDSIGFEKVLDILNFTKYQYNSIKSELKHLSWTLRFTNV